MLINISLDGVAKGHHSVCLRAAMGNIRRASSGCSTDPIGRQAFWRHLYQPTPGERTRSLGDLVEGLLLLLGYLG
jgi:hypothetical protein